MDKILKTIVSIPKDISIYCRCCEYELNGYFDLVRWLVDSKFGDAGWQERKFDEIQLEYFDCRHKKSAIMDYIKNTYVPIEFRQDKFEMIVDYIKNEVRVYENVTS